MKEKVFQMQFKRSFNFYCKVNNLIGHYHKIVDAGFLNPFDCYTLTKYGFVAHELKVNRQKNTFNFKALFGHGKQYHEILNLRQVIATGHKAWVIIAHKQPNNRFKAYLIHPKDADSYYHIGSIKMHEMKYLELQRIKNPVTNESLYDLTPLL